MQHIHFYRKYIQKRTCLAFMGKAWIVGDFKTRELAVSAYEIASKVLHKFQLQHDAQLQQLGSMDIERVIIVARLAANRFVNGKAGSQLDGDMLRSKAVETYNESKICEGSSVTQAQIHNNSLPNKSYPRIRIMPTPGMGDMPVHPAAALFADNPPFLQKASESHPHPILFNSEETKRSAENQSRR